MCVTLPSEVIVSLIKCVYACKHFAVCKIHRIFVQILCNSMKAARRDREREKEREEERDRFMWNSVLVLYHTKSHQFIMLLLENRKECLKQSWNQAQYVVNKYTLKGKLTSPGVLALWQWIFAVYYPNFDKLLDEQRNIRFNFISNWPERKRELDILCSPIDFWYKKLNNFTFFLFFSLDFRGQVNNGTSRIVCIVNFHEYLNDFGN